MPHAVILITITIAIVTGHDEFVFEEALPTRICIL
jgi:hypothetical protein